MKLDEHNISKMSDSFIATFLSACLQAKKVPYMDICLGFVYASKKVLRCMVELEMITLEQMTVIEETLLEAVEKNVKHEDNQKFFKIMKALSYEEENSVGNSQE